MHNFIKHENWPLSYCAKVTLKMNEEDICQIQQSWKIIHIGTHINICVDLFIPQQKYLELPLPTRHWGTGLDLMDVVVKEAKDLLSWNLQKL